MQTKLTINVYVYMYYVSLHLRALIQTNHCFMLSATFSLVYVLPITTFLHISPSDITIAFVQLFPVNDQQTFSVVHCMYEILFFLPKFVLKLYIRNHRSYTLPCEIHYCKKICWFLDACLWSRGRCRRRVIYAYYI